MSLEEKAMQRNKSLNIYGGIREAIRTYLDVPEFVDFYNKLDVIRKKCNGKEREKLDKLMVALSFTRLRIANRQSSGEYGSISVDANKNITPNTADMKPILDNLREYKKYNNLKYYSEYGGEISAYIKFWESSILNRPVYKNLLVGVPVKVVSKLDEDYTDYSYLTDGMYGFRMDYHVGWHITSADDLQIVFNAADVPGAKNISISFLADSKHRIYPPSRVDIYVDGKLYKTIRDEDTGSEDEPYITFFKTNVDFPKTGQVMVKAYRSTQPRAQLACDEIQLD